MSNFLEYITCLLSLRVMAERFIQVVCIRSSLLVIAESYSTLFNGFATVCLSVPPVDWHLGCFQCLAITNKVNMNNHVHVSV